MHFTYRFLNRDNAARELLPAVISLKSSAVASRRSGQEARAIIKSTPSNNTARKADMPVRIRALIAQRVAARWNQVGDKIQEIPDCPKRSHILRGRLSSESASLKAIK